MNSELPKYTETKELSTSGFSQPPLDDHVNAYLSLGWNIIGSYVTGCGNGHEKHEVMHLLLGWPAADPAPHPTQLQKSESVF